MTTETQAKTRRRWLRLDALNRAWRTVLQGLVAVVLFPALDAGVQVVRAAVEGTLSGRTVDWGDVRTRALMAAGTAALMAITAYVHRAKVDASAIPSALPPELPAGAPTQAHVLGPATVGWSLNQPEGRRP